MFEKLREKWNRVVHVGMTHTTSRFDNAIDKVQDALASRIKNPALRKAMVKYRPLAVFAGAATVASLYLVSPFAASAFLYLFALSYGMALQGIERADGVKRKQAVSSGESPGATLDIQPSIARAQQVEVAPAGKFDTAAIRATFNTGSQDYTNWYVAAMEIAVREAEHLSKISSANTGFRGSYPHSTSRRPSLETFRAVQGATFSEAIARELTRPAISPEKSMTSSN